MVTATVHRPATKQPFQRAVSVVSSVANLHNKHTQLLQYNSDSISIPLSQKNISLRTFGEIPQGHQPIAYD